MTTYRMPDGSITRNNRVRLRAFKELAREVLKFFPGYSLISFDPGWTFVKIERRPDGYANYLDRFSLNYMTVQTLIKNEIK